MTAIESITRFFGNHHAKVDTYFRAPLTIHLNGDVDAREGAIADGAVLGKFTLADLTAYIVDDGGVFTDDTTDANDVGTADVTVLPATEAVNDAAYVVSDDKFTGFVITLSTAGVGDTVVFEYWNGSAWTNLTTAHELQDDSMGFTAGTSSYYVTWVVPTDWVSRTITDGTTTATGYMVRWRVTAASYTTTPVASRIQLMKLTSGVGIAAPFAGFVDGASWTADTVSGSTDNTIIQIVNVTKGTTTSVTLTKAVAAGHAATANVDGLGFDKGDVLLLHCPLGDSTEFADVNLILEFKV